MDEPNDRTLGERELDVMGVLWQLGSGTVTEVRDRLPAALAYTTVLTILRTLAWFGNFRCLCSPDSVDLHNGKVVRASMGAIFHVPVEFDVSLASLPKRFTRLACLDLKGEPISSPLFRQAECYVFGNEARGLPQEQMTALGAKPFTIPGTAAIESLNVAAAVNISLYELNRKRASPDRLDDPGDEGS